MKKRMIALLLAAILVVTALPAAAAEVYTDVADGAWYAGDVQYVSRNGLMAGIGGGKFDPNGTATRGMVMTILARTAGVDTGSGSVWYTAGLDWAVAGGISDGTDPMGAITREQLAAILYRYAALLGCDLNYSQPLSAFSDASRVSEWAVDAVEWAVAAGLLKGAGGKLMPAADTTRAQLAAVLHRYCETVLGLEDARSSAGIMLWPVFGMNKPEEQEPTGGESAEPEQPEEPKEQERTGTGTATVSASENQTTEAVRLQAGSTVVEIPAGARLKFGVTALTLAVEKGEASNGIRVVTANEGSVSAAYRISVEGLAENAGVLMKVEMEYPAGLQNLKLYHYSMVMTPIHDAADAADGTYLYDSATGKLILWTTGFSPFSTCCKPYEGWKDDFAHGYYGSDGRRNNDESQVQVATDHFLPIAEYEVLGFQRELAGYPLEYFRLYEALVDGQLAIVMIEDSSITDRMECGVLYDNGYLEYLGMQDMDGEQMPVYVYGLIHLSEANSTERYKVYVGPTEEVYFALDDVSGMKIVRVAPDAQFFAMIKKGEKTDILSMPASSFASMGEEVYHQVYLRMNEIGTDIVGLYVVMEESIW